MSLMHQYYDSDVNSYGGQSYLSVIDPSQAIFEEGLILGRNKRRNSYPDSAGIPVVNGRGDDSYQVFWDGTYSVKLKRQSILLKRVWAFSAMGRGACNQKVFAPYEEVTITWLNRDNIYIPVILDGSTMDYFNKSVLGRVHLVDMGEQVLRSAISNTPEITGSGETDKPFYDNQFDNPATTPREDGTFDTNINKVINKPGGEVFLDKFGRVISLSRHKGHEFLTTYGKIDSGQDDVSQYTTATTQDSYYDAITNDESRSPDTQDLSEPFKPKPLNLKQYQMVPKKGRLASDKENKYGYTFGVLPRFDKWKFLPIVIRGYQADSDGEVVTPDTYSVFNERSNSLYSRTVTDSGDAKIFIPRHSNVRIAGDILMSVGGNYELKLKSQDRLVTGESNPNNTHHMEMLSSGALRLRMSENVTEGTAKFDLSVSESGSLTVLCGSSGASATSYKTKLDIDSSNGKVTLDSKNNIVTTASGTTEMTAGGVFTITAGSDITVTGDSGISLLSQDGTVIGGGATLLESMVTGDTLKAYLDALEQALLTWVPVPADGGASLVTLLKSIFLPVSSLDYLSKHNNKVN